MILIVSLCFCAPPPVSFDPRYELSTLRRKARMEKKLMLQQLSGRPRIGQETEGSASAPSPGLPPIPASASLVQLVHIVMPPHANHMNTMFGGILMEWAEEAARLAVHRHLHAMHQGDAGQNTKVLVRKFENMGQPNSPLVASKRWFYLSTVCASSEVCIAYVFDLTTCSFAVTWTAYPFLPLLRSATASR